MTAQQLSVGKPPGGLGIDGGIAQVRPAGPVPGVGQAGTAAQPVLQGIALTGRRQRNQSSQVEGVQPRPSHRRALPGERQVVLGQLVQQALGFAQVLGGAGQVLAGLRPTLLKQRKHFAAQVVAGKLCVSV
ncbi:hypothetical protein D3C75_784470 [compost metagenome]